MSLKLTIYSNAKNTLTNSTLPKNALQWNYAGIKEITVGAEFKKPSEKAEYYPACTIGLAELSFDKQMYRPGEIHARLHIAQKDYKQSADISYYLYSKKDLDINLLNCFVTLEDGNKNSIASNYYVYKITPVYVSDSLYVDLEIVSQDKKLTEKIENKTYVARRLFKDLLTDAADQKVKSVIIQPKNKLKLDGDSYSSEYILPYLVQYNESFYDMLVRTANRWGECIYFENGSLVAGRNGVNKIITSYTALSFINANENNPATKITKDNVTQDDYLDYFKKDDYLKHSGDIVARDDKYGHKIFQSLFNMKGNLANWITDQLIYSPIEAGANGTYYKTRREKEYDKYFYEDDKAMQDACGGSTTEKYYRAKTQYKEVICKKDYYEALDKKNKAEKEVEDELNKTSSNNFEPHDLVRFKKVETDPSGASDKLKNALKALEKAYDKYSTVPANNDVPVIKNEATAEALVNENAQSDYIYEDYFSKASDGTPTVNTNPTGASTGLKQALKRLASTFPEYYAKLSDDYKDALKAKVAAEEKVNKNAETGKTFKSYLDSERKVKKDGTSGDLKDALDDMEKAYDKLKTQRKKDSHGQLKEKLRTELAVNLACTNGTTFYDYVENAKMLDPSDASDTLKDKLDDWEDAYNNYIKLKKEIKDREGVEAYAPFAVLGPLDENDKNLSAVSSKEYKRVKENEIKAGQGMICVDFGVTYQHLCVGDVFYIAGDTDHLYLVTQVKGVLDKTQDIGSNSKGQPELREIKKMHFYVYAVPNQGKDFYPPMLPTGHIRTSEPQIATIDEDMDPKMNARYRIKYPWQDSDEDASPWIAVTHEMLSKGCGSVWHMEKGSAVLLNYEDGNIERPYIVGAVQTSTQKAPRANMFNTMNLSTPGGQAIRLSDGNGDGGSAFITSMLPVLSWIKKFTPMGEWKMKTTDSAKYEGGLELSESYGIYSIKASTDQRNISIKSPYGDVSLSAFSGISISAPNGEVKIAGKNVTIEAGNKIKLESGKNINNAILGAWGQTGNDATMKFTVAGLMTTAGKALIDKVVSQTIDLSIFRTTWEAFLRPIDGTLEIKSNRYLFLEAGKGEASIQRNRYQAGRKYTTPIAIGQDIMEKWECFVGLSGVITIINRHVDDIFNTIESLLIALNNAMTAYKDARAKIPNDKFQNDYKRNDTEADEDGMNICEKSFAANGALGNLTAATLFSDPTTQGFAAIAGTNAKKALVTVNAYIKAANKCYKFVHDYCTPANPNKYLKKDQIIAPIVGQTHTLYNDKVKNKATDPSVTGVFNKTLFDPNRGVAWDLATKRKEVKRYWFKAAYDDIKTAPGYPIGNTKNYTGVAGSWNTYVDGFSDAPAGGGAASWKDKLKAAAETTRDDLKQYLSKSVTDQVALFANPILDRTRWEPGTDGQIILSDQPASSVLFDPDGTPRMYLNHKTTKIAKSEATLRKLLHEWD